MRKKTDSDKLEAGTDQDPDKADGGGRDQAEMEA